MTSQSPMNSTEEAQQGWLQRQGCSVQTSTPGKHNREGNEGRRAAWGIGLLWDGLVKLGTGLETVYYRSPAPWQKLGRDCSKQAARFHGVRLYESSLRPSGLGLCREGPCHPQGSFLPGSSPAPAKVSHSTLPLDSLNNFYIQR